MSVYATGSLLASLLALHERARFLQAEVAQLAKLASGPSVHGRSPRATKARRARLEAAAEPPAASRLSLQLTASQTRAETLSAVLVGGALVVEAPERKTTGSFSSRLIRLAGRLRCDLSAPKRQGGNTKKLIQPEQPLRGGWPLALANPRARAKLSPINLFWRRLLLLLLRLIPHEALYNIVDMIMMMMAAARQAPVIVQCVWQRRSAWTSFGG